MPASPVAFRARIGLYYPRLSGNTNNPKFIASHPSLAFGWHNHCIFSIFMSFFLLSVTLFKLKKARISLHFSFKPSLAFVCYSLCHSFLLILAGDINPNPGPLNGKLKFGHWNLNSLLKGKTTKKQKFDK